MNTVAEIIEAARQRILAHRIQCSVDLLEYLSFRSSVEDVTLEVLKEEAVRQGLYRYLGEQHALALQSAISQATKLIQLGLICSEAELAGFIQSLAESLSCFRCEDRALCDLIIDARQGGLYELIKEGDRDGSTNLSLNPQYDSTSARPRGAERTTGGIGIYGQTESKGP
jgi:hypothetical protein